MVRALGKGRGKGQTKLIPDDASQHIVVLVGPQEHPMARYTVHGTRYTVHGSTENNSCRNFIGHHILRSTLVHIIG